MELTVNRTWVMFVFMRGPVRVYLSSIALALATTACGPGDDPGGTAETGEVSSSGAEGETDPTTGNDDSGFVQIPARGISITDVVANPGTRIPIASGADWVDGSSRLGFLPSDRDTLIRIDYTLEEGFTPRLIEARLHLEYPDGEVQTLNQIVEVDQPSNETFLDRSFYFGLVADEGQTVPGMKFQVELWEVAPGGEGFSEAVNVSPASGREIIGFEGAPMEMNIVFVPIIYNGSDPGITEEDRKFIVENGVIQHNPLQSVQVEWHDPIPYNQTISDLGQLLPVMSQLRQQEGRASSNWYYAALVRTGGGGVSGVAGIAYLVGSNLLADRVSANVWFRQESSTNTIVHEIGHNQGLQHVFCQGGGAANTNPSYPDPAGYIQQPGFGIRDFVMRPSSQYDYMSYCGPSWVSTWTWNVTYNRIRTMTAYDYDDGNFVVPPTVPLLKGIVFPDGRSEFWVGEGVFDGELSSGNHIIEIEHDGSTLAQPAAVSTLSDDESLWIEAPLPTADVMEIDQLRYRHGDRIEMLDRAQIARGHLEREAAN